MSTLNDVHWIRCRRFLAGICLVATLSPNAARAQVAGESAQDQVQRVRASVRAGNPELNDEGEFLTQLKSSPVADLVRARLQAELNKPRYPRVASVAAARPDVRKLAFREAVKIVAATKIPANFKGDVRALAAAGFAPAVESRVTAPVAGNDLSQPFDWQTQGKVTGVRNQLQCGSCWAFAAVAVAESSLLVQTSLASAAIDMSEQFALNARPDGGSCEGGWYIPVWELMRSQGIADEATVPYTGQMGRNPTGVATPNRVVTFGLVHSGANNIPTDDAMKRALVQYGPLAVAVDADEQFMLYGGGLFRGYPNDSDYINHAVTIVGWTQNGWIVKNSWDTTWGVNGYIEIAFGTNNIGYAAAWVTTATNGNPPPPNPNNGSLLKEADATSMEIWKQLALYQARLHAKHDDSTDHLPILDLRVESLRAQPATGGHVPLATDPKIRKSLKCIDDVREDWKDKGLNP